MSRDMRHGIRLKTRFETLYCSDRQEGEAVLADVSYSGALLEGHTKKPALGSRVMLYVCLPNGAKPVELRGKVVRYTALGFAIQYDQPNPDVVRFVDDAAALVSVLREDFPEGAATPSARAGEYAGAQLVLATDLPTGETILLGEEVPVGAPLLLSQLDLTPYPLSELEELARRIPQVIAQKREEAKARVREKMKKLAEQEGFSLEEVLGKS